eukprot:499067_1
MLTFDLKTKNKMTIIKQQCKSDCGLIFATKKLHHICNFNSGDIIQRGDHYIYDTKTFQKITTFEPFKNIMHYGLIYLKSQNSVYSFSGSNTHTFGESNSIYRFSCMDSKWEELNIKMPIALSSCGLVATKKK